MFFKRLKKQKVYEVYVVGRTSPSYREMVKVIGVAKTKEEACQLCVEHVKNRIKSSYVFDVTYWDDCVNIRVELAPGIVRSYTFNIAKHTI